MSDSSNRVPTGSARRATDCNEECSRISPDERENAVWEWRLGMRVHDQDAAAVLEKFELGSLRVEQGETSVHAPDVKRHASCSDPMADLSRECAGYDPYNNSRGARRTSPLSHAPEPVAKRRI